MKTIVPERMAPSLNLMRNVPRSILTKTAFPKKQKETARRTEALRADEGSGLRHRLQ
jgi:hypothetical protein